MLDYYEIGQRIRKYRKANAMSQEQLAEKVGISLAHMSHIETGNTKLSLTVLVDISQALEVRTDDILFEQEKITRSSICDEIVNSLNDCTVQQLNIIYDVIKATKISLNKHLE